MRGDKVAFADTRVYSRIHGKAKRPDINQLKRRVVEENKKDKKKTILVTVVVICILMISTLILRF